MSDRDNVLAANAAYYAAFVRGDYPAMEAVWADADITVIHPGWALIEGRADVLRSYRLILDNPDQEPVLSSREKVYLMGEYARVLCIETVGGGALAATNLFHRTLEGWRLIHHHASPIVQPLPRAQPTRQLN
jgi:ketosteroid isomerase-like protein